MKKRNLLALLLAACIFPSCTGEDKDNVASSDEQSINLSLTEQQKVERFEANFLDRELKVTSRSRNVGLSLYGYRTIVYHGEDSVFVNKLWAYYKKNIDKLGHFLVLDGKVRVYFPLKEAIIQYGNKVLYSDSLGCINSSEAVNYDIVEVTGRLKTRKSLFTKFKRYLVPTSIYKNKRSIIFDLGEKCLCCAPMRNMKRVKTRAEAGMASGVSCLQNHGGKNCTVAFGISSDRCVIKYDRCMDYNGFGSDCSGSHNYFVGSDCSKAMAAGHCWNEL